MLVLRSVNFQRTFFSVINYFQIYKDETTIFVNLQIKAYNYVVGPSQENAQDVLVFRFILFAEVEKKWSFFAEREEKNVIRI